MRERTPLPRAVIESLPRLKMIASTGPGNRSVDANAAGERGIVVTSTGYFSEPTVELTWGLIHASIRDIAAESSRSGPAAGSVRWEPISRDRCSACSGSATSVRASPRSGRPSE
jgi:phosphoglycerate dehydrogenase-like enzyme